MTTTHAAIEPETNAKHPPGPFHVTGNPGAWSCSYYDNGSSAHQTIRDANGVVIGFAVAHGPDPFNEAPDTQATADLFAAAPDLLKALQGAVALADKNKAAAEDEGRWVIRPPEMQRMYDACVAAIRKATGEQA